MSPTLTHSGAHFSTAEEEGGSRANLGALEVGEVGEEMSSNGEGGGGAFVDRTLFAFPQSQTLDVGITLLPALDEKQYSCLPYECGRWGWDEGVESQ